MPESVSPNADMRALAGGNWVCYVHANFRVEPRAGGGQAVTFKGLCERVEGLKLRGVHGFSHRGGRYNWEIDWAAPIREKGAGTNGCSRGDRRGIETGKPTAEGCEVSDTNR